MSSATLSSSPGPSAMQLNSKRTSSDSRDIEGRVTKRSRTTSEEPSAKSDTKDKKKRHKRKKRKVSVVVIEDGRARFKDARRGLSQSLAPFSPIKAGESSWSRSKSAVPANDRSEDRDVEGIVSSPKDKGKGKAIDPSRSNEPGPLTAEEQVARLTKELAFKNELIEKHQNAVIQTQQAITCQVCLELMYKPYALSPCGHLTCYECLVSWFKATPEDRPAPPSVLHRKKTCPHCRAAITDRPVQVWGVKSIVSSFSKNGLLQGNFLPPDESSQGTANENADPWDGIFRKVGHFGFGIEQMMMEDAMGGAGFLDDEDGGIYRCYDCMHEIWDGECSNCGRLYPGLDDADDDDDFELGHELGSDDDDDLDDEVGMEWMVQPAFHHLHGFGPGENPHAVAQDMHARLVEMEAEGAFDEGREPDFDAVNQFFPDGEEEEEEYEDSFIDDEEDVGIPRLEAPLHNAAEIIELSSGSEDEEENSPVHRRRPPAVRRRAGAGAPNRLRPIEVSDGDDDDDEIPEVRRSSGRSGRRGSTAIMVLSDSDEDDENTQGSSGSAPVGRREPSRTTRNRNRVESTDEDHDSDDGIDPTLADRVAAQERDMYGEDDSMPRHSRRHEDVDPDEEDLSFAILD